MTRIDLLEGEIKHYLNLGLTVIRLKHRSKKPIVRWRTDWNLRIEQLQPGAVIELSRCSHNNTNFLPFSVMVEA